VGREVVAAHEALWTDIPIPEVSIWRKKITEIVGLL